MSCRVTKSVFFHPLRFDVLYPSIQSNCPETLTGTKTNIKYHSIIMLLRSKMPHPSLTPTVLNHRIFFHSNHGTMVHSHMQMLEGCNKMPLNKSRKFGLGCFQCHCILADAFIRVPEIENIEPASSFELSLALALIPP